jgi:alkanesulfonate monooxygenase SsuD/methylene tetrahydromethanopterin reductase-like flavin-dependent oxidoreductase (luciferase family)
MKFGLFYEHQLPRPWSLDSEHRLLKESLEQIELADKLGYDVAWEVEHHFLEEYSHSSAPEVFLAAAAARTKRIRLGHGIIQLTTNHPARVAERVSTLDLISDGRVEFGIGEGSTFVELEPFGRNLADKRAVWEDAVRACLPMFWEEHWEYHGAYFDVPRRNVVPKSLQRPHPPLWVACSQLETIRMAGSRGLGALGFQFVSAESAGRWVAAYYNAYTKRLSKLCDYQTNPNVAVVTPLMCAPTDEEAVAKAEGWTFFEFALRYYIRHGLFEADKAAAASKVNIWEAYEAWRTTPDGQKPSTTGMIGCPATLLDRMRQFEASNIDQVVLLTQAGKNRHDDICASLELFAKEVMPEFQDRETQHQTWKTKVLNGQLDLPDTADPSEVSPIAQRLSEPAMPTVEGSR